MPPFGACVRSRVSSTCKRLPKFTRGILIDPKCKYARSECIGIEYDCSVRFEFQDTLHYVEVQKLTKRAIKLAVL